MVFGQKMYLFGGIFEITKELNDMLVYDFKSQRLSLHESSTDSADLTGLNGRLDESIMKNSVIDGGNSPLGRGKTMISPNRKGF